MENIRNKQSRTTVGVPITFYLNFNLNPAFSTY